MNILICTYSITRTAGGVFDAVKDLFLCGDIRTKEC